MSNVFACTGRLGDDAEHRATPSGTSILKFRIANDIGYGERKSTQWITCLIFGQRADGGVIDYLKKGSRVFVTGELRASIFESERNQKSYLQLDLAVDKLDLLGQPREHDERPAPGRSEREARDSRPPPARDGEPFADDIPF